MTATRSGQEEPKRDTQWYVLACDSGGYLGTVWEGNSSGGVVHPRKTVITSLDPPAYHFISMYCGRDDAVAEAGRAGRILPNRFVPVPIRVSGAGKDSRIVLK